MELPAKEKVHYDTIETVYKFCIGEDVDVETLLSGLSTTISELDTMMGGKSSLPDFSKKYLDHLKQGRQTEVMRFYLLVSPLIFFVTALEEASRKAYRNAVTACGMFCERIVRNILQTIDARSVSKCFDELKDSDFEVKNGHMKGELEREKFEFADELFITLKKIYFVRNKSGPHDVPPPEPVQARICINEILPATIDYLKALLYLGVNVDEDYDAIIKLVYGMTQTSPSLVFGPAGKRTRLEFVIKEKMYREGFFKDGKNLKAAITEMSERRFHASASDIANCLKKLCQGKNAILARTKRNGQYHYYERQPPEDYFQTQV